MGGGPAFPHRANSAQVEEQRERDLPEGLGDFAKYHKSISYQSLMNQKSGLMPPHWRQLGLYNRAAMEHVNKPALFCRTSRPPLEYWHIEYQDARQRRHKNDGAFGRVLNDGHGAVGGGS